MSPTTVTPNLLQLTRLKLVNAYLVREDDGFTLVDTLIPNSADAIIAAARAAGAEIRRIALTHAHLDHAGSVDELKAKLGQTVEFLCPETDAQILGGDKAQYGRLSGSWPKLKTRPDTLLNAGDRVGSLEVVPTPGHTPGHVAFRDTRDQAVIAGDVFVTVGGTATTSHFHLPFPLAWMGTWNKPMDLESAKTVRALDPSVLVVGHGGPVHQPTAAIDKAIAAAGG
jgi:glyoxylase-like metal-dependent hydrolase (beta-lactamase superfamily II)